MTAARWAEARRLLCIRLDSVGDVLLAGPAVSGVEVLVLQNRLLLEASGAPPASGGASSSMPRPTRSRR